MYSRIVVPLDGSDLSESALATATTFSKLMDAPIHVMQVIDTQSMEQIGGSAMTFNYSLLGEMFESEVNDAHAYIEGVVKRLEGEGHTVTSDVQVGSISRSILGELKEGDLVVMASHGRTGIRRWVLGSVAEEVTRRAQVPVLLVKAPHEDEAS